MCLGKYMKENILAVTAFLKQRKREGKQYRSRKETCGTKEALKRMHHLGRLAAGSPVGQQSDATRGEGTRTGDERRNSL